ncbi:uncharacterized protein [Rutidosis leptorrhynchoides]|uniref:uncharacterized protein n=1 Tax=Rutidosis leptorrhynchoides TaxID=125765 RepID=UPI003A9A5912
MSDRPRRREASWDKKQEMLSPGEIHSNVSWGSSPKWSKSEVNDGMMSGKFSGKHAREPLFEKRSGHMNDDFSRNRRRIETDPGFDEWEKQYSTHPSVDSYGPPYRGYDRRKGGNALASRDRDWDRDRDRDQDGPRSPYRSRSRSRGPPSAVTRSRSRSRGRDWGGNKARSGTGSPFNDDRHETNEYVDPRSWSRRQDHNTGGSRYGDYRRDDGNQFNDHNHRHHQSNRTSRIPCRFFAAGNCTRDDCRFSHDIPEPRHYYDGRSHEDIREHNSGNRNRRWHEQKPPDDLNRSDFSNYAKSNFGANKPWDRPSIDDVEPRAMNERSHKDIHDKNRTLDEVDASGQSSLDGSHYHTSHENSRNDIHNNRTSRDKNRIRDDVEPRGFNKRSQNDIHERTSHANNRIWDKADASGFSDAEKSNRNPDTNQLWNGSSRDDVSGSDFTNALKPFHNSDDIKKPWNGVDESSRDDINVPTSPGKNIIVDDVDASNFPDIVISNRRSDNVKTLDGLSCDEVGEPGHAEVEKSGWVQTNNMIRKWDGPDLNGSGSEKNDNLLPQWMGVGNDSNKSNFNIVSDDSSQQVSYVKVVHDMNFQSVSSLDEIKNPLNEPEVQLNEHVTGMNSHQQTQIQNKECGESLKSIDIDVPQVTSDANEANLTSQLAPQVNSVPVSLPELSQIEVQVPELYKDLNITDAIGYLQSLASSTTNMEVKANIKPEKTGNIIEKEIVKNLEADENAKQEQHNMKPEKVEEGDMGNDEKAMRVFKVALVEFVKEILKPKWKEGKLSREVHKNVVKKVVDKVTDAIQVNQIPRTQVKIEQYLAYSKPKITKLVEAYVERFLKA